MNPKVRSASNQPRISLLLLQDLGLSMSDLELLTGEDGDKLANWLLGYQPLPKWLILLSFLWSEFQGALERSREIEHSIGKVDNGVRER